ncbi:Icc-related predicted phosphoesterase [Actinomadura pelletieri DSM 43383]|uniref:Icc-related predicted phosphoesterase n=1 Tax=Actinomadura pelletieri DSM 43383 TaxID=1120940 RepID=A0A495QZQ5_9ACTN|nr:metallophosphoesterase [Actinomadura pelletieri]RKS79336.1 Icc-related predicted phosphoesterase [Actinomadura pelletieri DSM 43383]
MRIAFIGDVHGCVLHALGAAVALSRHRGIRLDAVIQVGDLGAFPSPDRWDDASRRFRADNPAQDAFFDLLDPSPHLAEGVRLALAHIPPILFLSGNHEDHTWLAGLHKTRAAPVTPVDPLGAYHHVACGHITEVAGRRTAFLGKIELPGPTDYDAAAYDRLLHTEPGSVDILVTHDGPYGMSTYRDTVQGSPKLTRLLEHLQPRLHVGGHYHHENGPRRYGTTTSYALAQLVPPKVHRRSPDPINPRQQVAAGGIGLLDTATYDFEYVHDPWLADVHGDTPDLTALINAMPS